MKRSFYGDCRFDCTCHDAATRRSAGHLKTKELASRSDGSVRGVISVKSGSGTASDPDRLAEFLETELLGSIPWDPSIPAAQDAGKPILVHNFASKAAKAYWSVAESLQGHENISKPPLDGSLPTIVDVLILNST